MISIERAHPSDAEAILAVQKRSFAAEAKLAGTPDIPPMAESLDEVVDQIRTACVLKAVDDDCIVGSIRGVVTEDLCTILRLSVDEAFRGKGLGSALLVALEEAHPAVSSFVLHTNAAIDANVRFYARHGYNVASTVRHSATITLACMIKANVAATRR